MPITMTRPGETVTIRKITGKDAPAVLCDLSARKLVSFPHGIINMKNSNKVNHASASLFRECGSDGAVRRDPSFCVQAERIHRGMLSDARLLEGRYDRT